MIDEKKIEEAADKFAQLERIYFNEYYPMKNGFKAGINWFKENLWHNASEVPTHDDVLVEYKDGMYGVATFMIFDKLVNVSRWLYIEDLKKGGE